MKKQLQKLYLLFCAALFALPAIKTAAQPCTPVYTSLCSSGDYINNFSTTGGTTNINNLNTGCNGNPNNYIDYSSTQFVTTSPGNTFNFTVQSGPSWSQGFRIWIDYNNNNSFVDPGEDVWNSGFSSTSAFTGSIMVPLTASGTVKMRIRCTWASVPADPCASYSFGETEDYHVVLCAIPPAPTASSPVQGCMGDSATLSASGTGTMAWFSQPTGGSSLGTGTSFNTPPVTVNDTFYVEAQDGGCVSSTRTPVIVNANPPPSAPFPSSITQCGGPVILDAGNPGSTYLWSTGAGTQQISVNQSNNYSVTIQTPVGCIGSSSVSVTINPPPPFALGSDTSQCGGSVALDAGSGFVNYNWSTGDTTQTSNASSSGNYYVTVSDANGCVLSDTMQVTINPAPSVNLGPDTTQCGGSVTLNAGNPGSVYFWSNSTTNQTSTVTSTNTYVVQVVTLAGCTSTDSINVTINPVPQVDFGPDTAACAGSIVLDAGNPGSTYAWNNGPPTQTNTVSTNGTYIVVVTSPAGCTESDTINVTLNSNPNVVANPDQTICAGSSASISATGAQSYLWSTGAQAPSITVSPTVSTTYYVTGTDVNGCQATDITTVYVQPMPVASFTYTMNGVTVQFTNGSAGAISYSWDFGDNQSSAQQNPTHVYTANGTYTVTLTVTGPCGVVTTQQVVVINGVGIADEALGLTLNLYPNPNNGQFSLLLELEKEQAVKIEVYDLRGARVYAEELHQLRSYNKQLRLDVESGMYLIRVQTEGGVVTKKFVIER